MPLSLELLMAVSHRSTGLQSPSPPQQRRCYDPVPSALIRPHQDEDENEQEDGDRIEVRVMDDNSTITTTDDEVEIEVEIQEEGECERR